MLEKQVWNEKMETLGREEVERVRLRKLRKQLKYCYAHSDFYKRKFDEVGFLPGDIKTWEDFRKIPPLMDKEEERANRNRLTVLAILSESIYVAPKKKSSWPKQQVGQPASPLSAIPSPNTIMIDGTKEQPEDTG